MLNIIGVYGINVYPVLNPSYQPGDLVQYCTIDITYNGKACIVLKHKKHKADIIYYQVFFTQRGTHIHNECISWVPEYFLGKL